MSKKALTDHKYELIKAHILNPENSPLPTHLQKEMNRIISMSKLLDKNPTIKHAVALHRSKFPDLSITTAYRDARIARKVYNSLYEFDFDFWQTWLINDIVDTIKRCRRRNTVLDDRVISQEHANLIKAIGDRPSELDDPHRNEKHSFYIMVNVNNQNIKIDMNNLHKLPEGPLNELNKILIGGNEIDDQKAAIIMKS